MDATSELTTPDTNDPTPCHVAADADLDPDHEVDDLAHDPHADDEGKFNPLKRLSIFILILELLPNFFTCSLFRMAGFPPASRPKRKPF